MCLAPAPLLPFSGPFLFFHTQGERENGEPPSTNAHDRKGHGGRGKSFSAMPFLLWLCTCTTRRSTLCGLMAGPRLRHCPLMWEITSGSLTPPLSCTPQPRPCDAPFPTGLLLGRTWAKQLKDIHLLSCSSAPQETPAGGPKGFPLCPSSILHSPDSPFRWHMGKSSPRERREKGCTPGFQ